MATVTKPIALDESFNTTEVTPRNIADVLAEELGRLGSKTASDVMYDNTDSGLVAENVQDALDEINGKVVQSDWEQTDPTKDDYIKNKPTTDLQTAVDNFSTLTGGLLSEAKLTLAPVQDLHGYDKPWSGGSGKNKLPLVLADIKADNVSGTWNGNVYSKDGIDFTILTDDADNVLGIKANGTATNQVGITITYNKPILAGSYNLNGTASGSGWTTSWLNVNVNGTNYNDIGSGGSFTVSADTTMRAFCYVANGATISNKTFYPMVRLSTESDPTFEPYSNECPISGHTEAELDVSDDDSTTAPYVTPLGTTIYMANIDMVSGECDVIGVGKDLSTLTYTMASRNRWLSTGIKNEVKIPLTSSIKIRFWSEKYFYTDAQNLYDDTSLIGIAIDNEGNLLCRNGDSVNTPTGYIVYELATPQHIQLSPQLIQTLVGENNLSAPLEGQTVDEVKYRQVFTFEDVVNYINGQGA